MAASSLYWHFFGFWTSFVLFGLLWVNREVQNKFSGDELVDFVVIWAFLVQAMYFGLALTTQVFGSLRSARDALFYYCYFPSIFIGFLVFYGLHSGEMVALEKKVADEKFSGLYPYFVILYSNMFPYSFALAMLEIFASRHDPCSPLIGNLFVAFFAANASLALVQVQGTESIPNLAIRNFFASFLAGSLLSSIAIYVSRELYGIGIDDVDTDIDGPDSPVMESTAPATPVASVVQHGDQPHIVTKERDHTFSDTDDEGNVKHTFVQEKMMLLEDANTEILQTTTTIRSVEHHVANTLFSDDDDEEITFRPDTSVSFASVHDVLPQVQELLLTEGSSRRSTTTTLSRRGQAAKNETTSAKPRAPLQRTPSKEKERKSHVGETSTTEYEPPVTRLHSRPLTRSRSTPSKQ